MLTATDEEQSSSLIYHLRSQNKLPVRFFLKFELCARRVQRIRRESCDSTDHLCSIL